MAMNKRVKCIPFPDIKNAYVVISAYKYEYGNGCKKCMSFFYDNGEKGAEWEPDYGPITVIYKCDKDYKKAQPHWFYDFYTGNSNWSQLSVNEEGLPDAFVSGNYEHIFLVLKDWSKPNIDDQAIAGGE